MLREAANESARVFSPTAGHRATEQRRDLARIPELLPPSLLLEAPSRNWHPPPAHPPTRKVSSLCLFVYSRKMEGMESKVYDELLNDEQKQHDGDEEEHLDYRPRKHSSWSIGRSIHLFITTVLALALIYQQWRLSRQQICQRGFPTDYGKKDGMNPRGEDKVVDRRIRPILTFPQGTWEISLVSRNRNIPTPLSSLKIVPDWKFPGRTIGMPQNLGMRSIERGTNFSHVSTYYHSPRGVKERTSKLTSLRFFQSDSGFNLSVTSPVAEPARGQTIEYDNGEKLLVGLEVFHGLHCLVCHPL